jgi:predicted dinucleotide-binding enzyme
MSIASPIGRSTPIVVMSDFKLIAGGSTMRIGILGTGVVSQALGGKLAELGHEVMVGTRDVARTMANQEPNQYGMPAFSIWHEQHPEVKVGTFADAARHGEAVINATNGMGSLAALALAGASNLDGKILMDISNPLATSHAGCRRPSRCATPTRWASRSSARIRAPRWSRRSTR